MLYPLVKKSKMDKYDVTIIFESPKAIKNQDDCIGKLEAAASSAAFFIGFLFFFFFL